MKYTIEGGGHVEAASPLDLVEALRQDAMAWAPSVSIEDYMEGLAARSRTYNNSIVRTDSVENFVHDLVEVGFLTPVPAS